MKNTTGILNKNTNEKALKMSTIKKKNLIVMKELQSKMPFRNLFYTSETKSVKIIIIALLLILFCSAKAQVGINTSTPQKTLHINGSLQLVNELNVGGTSSTAGNSGLSGQVLTSNGSGNAPTWTDAGVPSGTSIVRLSAIGLRTTNGPNTAANTYTTIIFQDIPKIDTSKLTYNASNGSFTVLKAGYYQVILSSELDMSLNGANQTSGTAQSVINKNAVNIAIMLTGHGERTDNVNHTVIGVSKFNVGDVITTQMTMTRNYRIGDLCSITISYLSE